MSVIKVVKSSAKFKKKHPGLSLVSVTDAAELAGVTYKTIWYHVHKSRRVRGYYNLAADRICVVWQDVMELYPETKKGVKQSRTPDAGELLTKIDRDVYRDLLTEYTKKGWKGASIESVIDDLSVRLKSHQESV